MDGVNTAGFGNFAAHHTGKAASFARIHVVRFTVAQRS